MSGPVDEMIAKLEKVQTKEQLDYLRPAVGAIISAYGKDNFDRLQSVFIRTRNRIRYGRGKAMKR